MDERTLESIKNYLHREDVQERIQQNIHHGRSQITVPIGGAVGLFHFSENQLRKWEEKGLLEPKRDGRHRHYTLQDLDKLAIIRVLIDAKYSPSDIPPEIDSIWFSMVPSDGKQGQGEQFRQPLVASSESKDNLPINVRIENAREELFWRYFASHALRLSLALICEDIPGTPAGLVLPLGPNPAIPVRRVEDLPQAGESLVGWLSKSRSSHTLFTSIPSFQYSTDYSLLPLTVMKDDKPLEEAQDKTLIVLDRQDRRSKLLSLSSSVVETIRLLLAPLYENAQILRPYFGSGMRDELDPAPDLDSTTYTDLILDGLADMVVHLGGHTSGGQDRWRFCCILLPKDPSLPLQQRTLVVRAQSQHSPHRLGTLVSPDKSVNSLSLRAYQSGHVIYRSKIFAPDASVALQEVEEPIHSALAVPVEGENGLAIAVLYIISDQTEAFSESNQRLLRMLGRMIGEAISIYRARQQATVKLADTVAHPRSVDPLFEDFLSENDFIRDVEDLLTTLKARLGEWKEPIRREAVSPAEREERFRADQLSGEVVSFIAVDIDNQSSLATMYGDQVARNLSKAVGSRIQKQQRFIANPEYRRLYHIFADRFYLLLRGITLDEVRTRAEQLRNALEGEYLIEARRTSAERLRLPADMLELSHITVRLGVTSYGYRKLEELLQRYAAETATANVRAQIMSDLDQILDRGREKGGNVIFTFDPKIWEYTSWSPSDKVE